MNVCICHYLDFYFPALFSSRLLQCVLYHCDATQSQPISIFPKCLRAVTELDYMHKHTDDGQRFSYSLTDAKPHPQLIVLAA